MRSIADSKGGKHEGQARIKKSYGIAIDARASGGAGANLQYR